MGGNCASTSLNSIGGGFMAQAQAQAVTVAPSRLELLLKLEKLNIEQSIDLACLSVARAGLLKARLPYMNKIAKISKDLEDAKKKKDYETYFRLLGEIEKVREDMRKDEDVKAWDGKVKEVKAELDKILSVDKKTKDPIGEIPETLKALGHDLVKLKIEKARRFGIPLK
jgi:hypothetical protein